MDGEAFDCSDNTPARLLPKHAASFSTNSVVYLSRAWLRALCRGPMPLLSLRPWGAVKSTGALSEHTYGSVGVEYPSLRVEAGAGARCFESGAAPVGWRSDEAAEATRLTSRLDDDREEALDDDRDDDRDKAASCVSSTMRTGAYGLPPRPMLVLAGTSLVGGETDTTTAGEAASAGSVASSVAG